MNDALVEGATVSIGATLLEGATLEIGDDALDEAQQLILAHVTLVEIATLEIGEWRTTMPLLLEPISNSNDSTGIKKQLQ